MRYIYIYNEVSRASEYGIGTYLRQMVKNLKHLDNSILVIVNSRSNCNEFEIKEKDGYIIYNIPSPNVFIKSFDNKYYRNIAYIIMSILPDSSCNEILFCFNYIQEYYIFKEIKAKIASIKGIFTIHYQNWCFLINGNKSLFKKIIHNKYNNVDLYKKVQSSYMEEKAMYQLVDFIVCLSEYTKQLLVQEYGINKQKIKYIPNAVAPQRYIKEQRDNVKKSLLIPYNEFVILFVGRLDEIKQVDIVIRAFKLFNKAYIPNSRLIIVGEGNFALYLKECKGYWNRITFTGKLTKSELNKFYQVADVGILLSLHEQCSYTVLEMLSYGIPVIGSNSTGLEEMIENKNRLVKYQ